MRKILLALFSFCIIAFYFYWQLPNSETIVVTKTENNTTATLIPLDSRPVCTKLPQQLASLAGVDLILPPNEFLDNYRTPAKKEKIIEWLFQRPITDKTTYISNDMLLSGSLIQARKQAATISDQEKLLKLLTELKRSRNSLATFQIIPRLLVSDELIPDRWYKYRLLRYAQLYDMVETFNDFHMTEQLEETIKSIPADVLNKYCLRYNNQDILNAKLIQLADSQLSITIGQDDASPFGLPHRSANLVDLKLLKLAKPLEQATLTYGADEIASVLIARTYLKESSFTPKVFIQYADNSIPNLIMPYMPISVEGIISEKLAFLNTIRTHDKSNADIILYVNCGSDNYSPSRKQALELRELISKNQYVALLDLSANFEEKELLLPQALKFDVPLNKLCAYAGWNTFSNSAGTVLAQAVIFVGREKELSTAKQKLQLRTENLEFTVNRILDDYVYQKKLHANLKKELLMRGIEPTELNQHDHQYAQALAQFFLKNQALLLLHSNLGKTPYYTEQNNNYYIKDIDIKAKLPWPRIFEVELSTKLTIGKN
ncbi:MAG: DUF4127 family protein [Phascolarctobacterium sp.]|nr:DUF4127 family protein [Phascolarctobacterium sp.]